MWHDKEDASIKVAIMNDYAEALYFVLLSTSESKNSFFDTEKRFYGDVATLVLPLRLALNRYDKEEFPLSEEIAKKKIPTT